MAQHYFNGEWVAAAGGETLPVIDPSTGEVFDTLPTSASSPRCGRATAAARRGWPRP